MLRMNRTVGGLWCLAALVVPACIVVPPPAPVTSAVSSNGLEYGINRPGYDYKSFDPTAPDPLQCQSACYAEPQCLSFTYVSPGVQGPNAHCWLKNAVAPAVADGNCTSGLKVAYSAPPQPIAPAYNLENDTNRSGSDFNNFDVPSAEPSVCQDACLREPACRAFTFVRPGIQGPNARCWLKNSVPPPTRDTCCMSGLK